MLSISYIIPCYNGETFIFSNIKKLVEKNKKLKINYEIIIVNDGSTDNTNLKISRLQKIYKKIKLVDSKVNYGKSFSIRKGLAVSKFEHIILLDADLPYFSYVPKIINELKKNTELVIVDRNHSKSILLNKPLSFYQFFRKKIGKIISKIIFYVLNINMGIIDTQAGLKGFRKIQKFNKNKFISKKFFLDIEIIYFFKKMRKKICLVPVKYNIEENSTINLFSIKNIQIIYDFIKVITHLKFKN